LVKAAKKMLRAGDGDPGRGEVEAASVKMAVARVAVVKVVAVVRRWR
jgi:hypothetical protein